VLRVLVALTLLTGAVSLTGLIPLWSFVLPLLLIVAFLVLARRQVRIANEAYWERAATSRPKATNVVRRSAARVDASHGAARASARDDGEASADDGSPAERIADEADDEPTVTLTAQQMAAVADVAQEHAVAVSLPTADGASLWDPLPVTLPTYVGKPVAKRTVRNIAVGEPATWSSGHAPANGSSAAGPASQRMPETENRDEAADNEAAAGTQRAANG
jgi:hypothetical protein